MQNKGIIITLIILLIILIIGLSLFLVFALSGNIMWLNSNGKKSQSVIYEGMHELQNINEIEVKVDAGDITFEKSKDSSLKVVIYGKNSQDVRIDSYGDKIKIDYQRYKKTWFSFGNYKDDVIIYIPENYSGKINIDNDYGECKITDLENATVDIDSDAGNVELGKIKNANIECDYGNIQIDTILNKCSIKADLRKY